MGRDRRPPPPPGLVPAAPGLIGSTGAVTVTRAKVGDVREIKELVDDYAGPILLEKSLANLFEDVTEFWVARLADGVVVGCGALHVFWEDLGEIRTVATDPAPAGTASGARCARRSSGTPRISGCTGCSCSPSRWRSSGRWGSSRSMNSTCPGRRYAELRSSYDRGVAEFLDLPYVKPNTLGNTRMLKIL